jgi:hypothetical protein
MKYFILTCSIFIISCSVQKSIFSYYNSEGFNITSLKGSSIRLYINPVIDIGEFRKSFENEYTSNSLFCSILTNKLEEKLSRFSMIYIDPNVNMDTLFLNQSILENNSTRVKGLFEQINENYLLGIKRVVISKSVDQNPQTPPANTSVSTPRNRMTVGSSTNEIKKADACVIKIVAEVWSVKEKKKVAEFTSIGQSKIFLLMYGRALNEALEYSVSNLANYIEENNE